MLLCGATVGFGPNRHQFAMDRIHFATDQCHFAVNRVCFFTDGIDAITNQLTNELKEVKGIFQLPRFTLGHGLVGKKKPVDTVLS